MLRLGKFKGQKLVHKEKQTIQQLESQHTGPEIGRTSLIWYISIRTSSSRVKVNFFPWTIASHQQEIWLIVLCLRKKNLSFCFPSIPVTCLVLFRTLSGGRALETFPERLLQVDDIAYSFDKGISSKWRHRCHGIQLPFTTDSISRWFTPCCRLLRGISRGPSRIIRTIKIPEVLGTLSGLQELEFIHPTTILLVQVYRRRY